MKRGVKYSQIGVKVAIGIGILLGLALLAQTVATYFFVYNKIVQDQTAQEIERKEAALMRSAFNARVSDPRQFGPLLDELKRDSPKEIAWLRIIDRNSNVLAQAGTPANRKKRGWRHFGR